MSITIKVTKDVIDHLKHRKRSTWVLFRGEAMSDNVILVPLLKDLPALLNAFMRVDTETDTIKTLTAFKAALDKRTNTEAVLASTKNQALAYKN